MAVDSRSHGSSQSVTLRITASCSVSLPNAYTLPLLAAHARPVPAPPSLVSIREVGSVKR